MILYINGFVSLWLFEKKNMSIYLFGFFSSIIQQATTLNAFISVRIENEKKNSTDFLPR